MTLKDKNPYIRGHNSCTSSQQETHYNEKDIKTDIRHNHSLPSIDFMHVTKASP